MDMCDVRRLSRRAVSYRRDDGTGSGAVRGQRV